MVLVAAASVAADVVVVAVAVYKAARQSVVSIPECA